MSIISFLRVLVLLILISVLSGTTVTSQTTIMKLNQETASRLARIPMACLNKEFPNKLNQVLGDQDDLKNLVSFDGVSLDTSIAGNQFLKIAVHRPRHSGNKARLKYGLPVNSAVQAY